MMHQHQQILFSKTPMKGISFILTIALVCTMMMMFPADTFAISNPISASSGTRTYEMGSAGTVIDPALTVSSSLVIYSAQVSIISGLNGDNDRLVFTDYTTSQSTTISGVYSTSSGILTLSGKATAADYQAALRTVQYKSLDTNPSGSRTIAFTFSGKYGSLQFPLYQDGRAHFYQVITATSITWGAAQISAAALTTSGLINTSTVELTGYLATITSATENQYIADLVSEAGLHFTGGNWVDSAWIGGNDATTEGSFYWATGPEAGTLYYVSPGSITYGYISWYTGEPNNGGTNNEDYSALMNNYGRGVWNDSTSAAATSAFAVEFSTTAAIADSSPATKVIQIVEPPTAITPTGNLYYSLMFETNGGNLMIPVRTAMGTTAPKPAAPVKAGYTFGGWYEDADFTTTFDFSTKIKSNTWIFAKWIPVADSAASGYFVDLGNFGWAANAINQLHDKGIVNGIQSDQYGPANNIIRGDFMLMLYRAFDLKPATEATGTFQDVSSNDYYNDAIQTAKSLGIAQGSDGYFVPQGNLTRQDAMVLVYRTLALNGKTLVAGTSTDLAGYTDESQIADYAKVAVSSLVKAGLIQGDGTGYMKPMSNMSRAEMAVILQKAMAL